MVSPPTLPESFLTSRFAAGQPLACTATLGCSSPVPDLELHEVLVSPFLQPVQVTSYLQHPGAPQRGQTAAGKGSSWPRLGCEILICNGQTQQDRKAQNGYLPTES